MKIKVFCDGKLARIYVVDSYEEVFEDGNDVLYVERSGKREKACALGDFGYGYWGYEVERDKVH